MLGLVLRILITGTTMVLLALYVPGLEVTTWGAALIFAMVLGVINAVVKPVIIILTLPITILTIGLFTLVLNALLFWLASSLVFGVEVETFAAAFWSALLLSIASWLGSVLTGKK